MAKTYKKTVYVGMVNGKQVNKKITATSQKELDRLVIQTKQDINNGKDVYSSTLFDVWANNWLEFKKSTGTKKNYIDLKSKVDTLNTYFAGMELKNITLAQFQNFLEDMANNNPHTQKPSSVSLLNKLKTTASQIFKYAIANNIAGVNDFFQFVKIPNTVEPKSRCALTEEQIQWVIDTEHRAKPIAMVMLFAGLRLGEAIPLQWCNIDFNNNTISVCKFVERNTENKNRYDLKEQGKTKSSRRTIPIAPILLEYLLQLKQDTNAMPFDYICPTTKGKMQSRSSYSSLWKSYLHTLNLIYGYNNEHKKYTPEKLPMRIPKFTAHYLRHTFATLLYLQGTDKITAMQVMGHSDYNVTVNIYTDIQHNQIFNLSDTYKNKLQNEFKIIPA